jgi:hypothetical protein
VMHAMPPYGLWEQPPATGRIPPHRTRCGNIADRRGSWSAPLYPGQR